MNHVVWKSISRKVLFGAVAQLIMTNLASAQPTRVEWKFYGGVSANLCFFDAKGVTQLQGNHIRVWAKCLPQKELDSIDIKKSFKGRILEEAAQKVAKYYVPPIASLEDFGVDQLVTITQYEVTADLAGIEPQATMLYELNCREKMIRELSIALKIKGRGGQSDKPYSWRHVAPETNGARLLSLLCPIT